MRYKLIKIKSRLRSAFFVGFRRILTHANTSETAVNVPPFKKRILQIREIKEEAKFRIKNAENWVNVPRHRSHPAKHSMMLTYSRAKADFSGFR